jgi:hypothetical protein
MNIVIRQFCNGTNMPMLLAMRPAARRVDLAIIGYLTLAACHRPASKFVRILPANVRILIVRNMGFVST